MNCSFSGKRISSLVTVVPPNEVRFEDEIGNFGFSRAKSMKLAMVMGFDRHRLADEGTCASDLCLFGLQHLVAAGHLRPEEIDALIFVSQTPDHLIPPTSNLIQSRAGLGRGTFCLDINQGSAGFVVGLLQAFMMLELHLVERAVLMTGDTLSHRVGKRDRNSYPIVGDAGSVAVVENDPGGQPIHAVLYMDGSLGKALHIPAGGARLPSSPETCVEEDAGDGNFRSREHYFMDGPAVFNFVQTEVPPMIEELLAKAGCSKDEVDFFLFHQPNRFMLEKLADAMKVPREKMPSNIVENFGNASSATIPTCIAFNLATSLRTQTHRVCLGGFGAGLAWGSILMNLGPMLACELVEYQPPDR